MRAREANVARGKYWDRPWGLVEGCTPVSEGCDHCWARAMDARFYGQQFVPRFRDEHLDIPLRRRVPTVFAVWNDLLHECVTPHQIHGAFGVMKERPEHTFLILTKRAERLPLCAEAWAYHFMGSEALRRIWLGVTVESAGHLDRLDALLRVPAAVRWVSLEPLLGPVDILRYTESGLECSVCNWRGCESDTDGCHFSDVGEELWACPECDEPCTHTPQAEGLDWVVVGCESGPHRRPAPWAWIRSVVDQCTEARVPVFVKQVGANPDGTGPVRRRFDRMPAWARRREVPKES